jgi:Porin subfamily
MIRQGLGLVFVSMAAHAAGANDIMPAGQTDKARADIHCSTLGEGFFAVAGSNACIKISGRISAGAGFGPSSGAVRSFEPRIGGNPADTAFDAAAAASGDLRFDTAAGPARVYVGVRKDTNPGWLVNGQ